MDRSAIVPRNRYLVSLFSGPTPIVLDPQLDPYALGVREAHPYRAAARAAAACRRIGDLGACIVPIPEAGGPRFVMVVQMTIKEKWPTDPGGLRDPGKTPREVAEAHYG